MGAPTSNAWAVALKRIKKPSICVNAFQSNVPPHLVQRWLGDASLDPAATYCDVIGPEEHAFTARMWVRTELIDPASRSSFGKCRLA